MNILFNRKFIFFLIGFVIFSYGLLFYWFSKTKYLISNFSTPQTNLTIIKKDSLLFCMILTVPSRFKLKKPQTVYNIWGNRCDNFKFITLRSNFTFQDQNETLNYKNLFLQPKGFEIDTYANLSNKVLTSFKQVYLDYPNYDWYLKADDDTFIEMNNLREFLRDKNPREPVTYGQNFKLHVKGGYHSGGGGYLLSNEAVKRLGSALVKNENYCKMEKFEDVDVARCLRDLNVFMGKSSDEQDKERFFSINILDTFYGNLPSWYLFYIAYNYSSGVNCCSDSFISFHYMDPDSMIRLNTVMTRLTFLLNKIESQKITKKPKFHDVIFNFINLEKIEIAMKKLNKF